MKGVDSGVWVDLKGSGVWGKLFLDKTDSHNIRIKFLYIHERNMVHP